MTTIRHFMRAICSAKYVYEKGVITGRTQKPSLFFKVLYLFFNQESKVYAVYVEIFAV